MVIHSSPLILARTLLSLFIGNPYGQQVETRTIPADSVDTSTTFRVLLEQRRPGYDCSVSSVVSPPYFFSERGSRTDISPGGIVCRDGDEMMVSQLGKQDIDGSVHIESALCQRNNFAWGATSYTYRATEGTRFNETTDYQLLAPYVIGDTAYMARLYRDLYTFGAGTAYRLGNWLLSLKADYRTTLAYRTQDLHPRNPATLPEGQLSVGYQFADYALTLAGTLGRYKQSNQADFLGEVGVASEYHFTGVGGDYYRFRGNNTPLSYQGISYGLSLDVTPMGQARQGFYALVAWHLLMTSRIVREPNNLSFSALHLHTLDLQAGYTVRSTRLGRWGVALYTQDDICRGTVHLFGDPKGNPYPRIAAEQSHYRQTLEFGAKGLWDSQDTPRTPWSWDISIPLGCRLHEEDLLPQVERLFYHLGGTLVPYVSFHRGQYFVSPTPAYSIWAQTGHPSLQLTSQHQPMPTYAETLERAFQIVSSTQMTYGLPMTHGYQPSSRYALWFSLDYLHMQTKLHGSDYGVIRCDILF